MPETHKGDSKPLPIEIPEFVKVRVDRPVFVDKEIQVEKIILIPVEKEYEVPKLVNKEYERPVIKDVNYERPRCVDREYHIPVIVKDETYVAVRKEDYDRLQAVAKMLPDVLSKLEQIVKWVPKEKEVEVQKYILTPVEVTVERPVYKDVIVEKPSYQEVTYEKPVIREVKVVVKKLAVRNKDGELEDVGYAKE